MADIGDKLGLCLERFFRNAFQRFEAVGEARQLLVGLQQIGARLRQFQLLFTRFLQIFAGLGKAVDRPLRHGQQFAACRPGEQPIKGGGHADQQGRRHWQRYTDEAGGRAPEQNRDAGQREHTGPAANGHDRHQWQAATQQQQRRLTQQPTAQHQGNGHPHQPEPQRPQVMARQEAIGQPKDQHEQQDRPHQTNDLGIVPASGKKEGTE